MITKEVFEEQKALSDRWKEMYYEKKSEAEQLTNNWNELEEWLIELKTPKTDYWGDTGFTYMLKIDVILDKMEEIRGNNDTN